MNVDLEELRREFESMSIKELEEGLKKVTELSNKIEILEQGIEKVGEENE